MLLTNFIPEECIVCDLEATNKADAIRELVLLLFRTTRLKGMSAALEQIMAREAVQSTGIGRGIALPHTRVPGSEDLLCAVGRTSKGLDFRAVDEEPVRIVFLICYPPAKQTTYINFVATVAKFLRDNGPLEAILQAESATEIFTILNELPESLLEPEEALAYEKTTTDSDTESRRYVSTDLVLLARLELCIEMLDSARSGRDEIQQRIASINALLDPSILEHYRRLKKRRGPALVAVEGGVCQGCFRQLPTELEQRLYRRRGLIRRCSNCNRFIYTV
jgi:mannitol/fructose-specific phosphotransferase system IIA component (Ntr-type)